MEPRVSVIIPTFNRAAWLGQAARSVLAQSFVDFELLIVDDGSTDDTPALVRELAVDPRVRGLRQAQRGIGAAMNLGLTHARGAYLVRLDSDDLWLPDLLATEVAVLDAEPDVDVVYARGQLMDASGDSLDETWGHAPRFSGSMLRSMLYADFTCNITAMVRRTCLRRVGPYDESLSTSEDYDLWLRCALEHRFAFVDRVLARVRIHEDSASFAPHAFAHNRAQRERVLDNFFARADLPPAALAMRTTAYANLHTDTAVWAWRRGEHGEALHAFGRALRQSSEPLWVASRFGFFVLGASGLERRSWWQRSTRLAAKARHRLRNFGVATASKRARP